MHPWRENAKGGRAISALRVIGGATERMPHIRNHGGRSAGPIPGPGFPR